MIKQLPWIKGGKPVMRPVRQPSGRTKPVLAWEGGEYVLLEPGDLVTVDDDEAGGYFEFFEALDEVGASLLEAERLKQEGPARRVLVSSMSKESVEILRRGVFEKLRRKGRMRELCQIIVAEGNDPAKEDLEAAKIEARDEPLPDDLAQYVAEIESGQRKRKTGPKGTKRTTVYDALIQMAFSLAVEDVKEHFGHKKREPILRLAKERIADEYGISERTIESIVKGAEHLKALMD